MGIVYQAHDPLIDRAVAIKLVRADLLDGADRDEFLALFRREAKAAGQCAHPNIVALYDLAMHEGNPFLAMEYVEGPPLSRALKQVGRYSPADAVALALQLLDALSAAHALGIVHRDVKPANILLSSRQQVKVTDFGISRINTSELTLAGRVVGTPAYMSPEQCLGEAVDHRSDLFSVGSLLYELLSGSRPFQGRDSSSISYHLLNSEPRDLTGIVPDVPGGLMPVLRKAMEKSRDARYSSAKEMADSLREALAGPELVRSGNASTRTDFSEEQIERVERALTRALGPIAKVLVRRALPRAGSEASLWRRLAAQIPDETERARFLALSPPDDDDGTAVATRTSSTAGRRGTKAGTTTGDFQAASSGATAAEGLSPAQIAFAERALMRYLGPIAKLLVSRATSTARSEAALWEQLAAHIQNPADRAGFLRQRMGG
jgi:serine/threonine-protein kinase